MNNPLISVIIPVYKVEEYLDECIESVVNQTYKNLEIILVDDGSPDNCPAICDVWAKKDGRINVIHKENGGLSSARNAGLKTADGEYILFFDSDDFVKSDIVEFLFNLSERYGADVAKCGFSFYYDEDRIYDNPYTEGERELNTAERIKELVVYGYEGSVWNKLYKSSVIKDMLFMPEDGCSEDIMFNYRLYKKAEKIVCCDVPKYFYRIRNDSAINNTGYKEGAFDIIRAKQIIMKAEKNNAEIYPFTVKGFVVSAFIVITGCITHNAFKEKKDALIQELLSYKGFILKSNLFTKSEKLKTVLLSISPKIYERLIIWKHSKKTH